jgi:hypothetical protein
MEILPILHTSEQKQLAFWSLKSAPCRIYGGKKGWFVEHLYAVSIKSFGITFYSIARMIQRLIKMSGENWKGQLAKIGCRAHIMHGLDYFLLYFRQFTTKKSIWFVHVSFIQLRLIWNLSIHVISEVAVSCLSLHSLWH